MVISRGTQPDITGDFSWTNSTVGEILTDYCVETVCARLLSDVLIIRWNTILPCKAFLTWRHNLFEADTPATDCNSDPGTLPGTTWKHRIRTSVAAVNTAAPFVLSRTLVRVQVMPQGMKGLSKQKFTSVSEVAGFSRHLFLQLVLQEVLPQDKYYGQLMVTVIIIVPARLLGRCVY